MSLGERLSRSHSCWLPLPIGTSFMRVEILKARADLWCQANRLRNLVRRDPRPSARGAGARRFVEPVALTDLCRKIAVSFFCLLILYWPLIDVRYYYLDDMARSVEGYYAYTSSGRPLTDILLSTLTLGGERLTDIAPAPQLLGVF